MFALSIRYKPNRIFLEQDIIRMYSQFILSTHRFIVGFLITNTKFGIKYTYKNYVKKMRHYYCC